MAGILNSRATKDQTRNNALVELKQSTNTSLEEDHQLSTYKQDHILELRLHIKGTHREFPNKFVEFTIMMIRFKSYQQKVM